MCLTRRRLLLSAAALALGACGGKPYAPLPAGSRVLALGDSLTFGYGAPPEAAYPAQLAQISRWQVHNGGVSGDTAAQALARLPALLHAQPQLILLGIGGNDFLRRVPEAQTRDHISRIIAASAGIPLVLIAQPKPSLSAVFGHLDDHPLYAELAKQHDIPLFAGGWSAVLANRDLKSDAIHANAAGYRRFAERLAAFLKKQGFLS
ncbi:GDSL-type esterase/lipase family protein [Conchiformibius kuhniae]|uniref:GDSL-type esterase/lipase family protein n=1 Tax=Conchiformibius kuhniae TaxID=211502 RepID=A0A8T9MVH3_9NEIS|nr:GDSL-type esterase/lipase family protein [Conchiformibius kuhniae]UOP05687.1 GDSL-type esterase/lipase family protein [Conchiformibius kuhniae]